MPSRTSQSVARNGAYKEAQLLAAQGYAAVLLPNFRGTLGLGRTMYHSARGQFGLKMQEDLEDAHVPDAQGRGDGGIFLEQEDGGA